MGIIRPFAGTGPRLDPSVLVLDGALVVGDVEIGPDSSVWFGTILRGDVNRITVGARTNLQDGTIVHVNHGTHPTVIGNDVTVGHRATLHGCTILDRCLVGIGSIVMDGAVVGPDAIVGAGALVPPNMKVPPGTLVVGAPARVKRELGAEERAHLLESARHYVEYARQYRREGWGAP